METIYADRTSSRESDYDEDDLDDERSALRAPADFDGPLENRHCTDVFMLLLLFALWSAMTVVGLYVVDKGDYRRLLYPLDYDGNICGTDLGPVDMTDYPLLYYINSYTGGVCVSSCPSVSKSLSLLRQEQEEAGVDDESLIDVQPVDVRTLVTYAGVYQVNGSVLPVDYIQMPDYSNFSDDALECTSDLCWPSLETSWNSPGIARGFGMAYYAGDTYEWLWRCYYTNAAEEAIYDQAVRLSQSYGVFGGVHPVSTAHELLNDYVYADLYVARHEIVAFGIGLCVVLSLIYIILLRIPMLLKTIVWTSVLATIALFFVGGYYAYTTAEQWQDEQDAGNPWNNNTAASTASNQLDQVTGVDDTTIKATRIAAFCLWVVGFALLILVCCLRRQISIAIGCVKAAGKAVNHMILLLGIPILQAVGMLLFVTIWIWYAVHLASMGDVTVKEIDLPNTGAQIAIRKYEWSPFVVRCGWFFLFCLFWTANFIVALGDVMVALTVAKYYFTRQKWKIGSWSVIHSVWQVVRYHIGTCAYGSLLIASIQLIRVAIAKARRAAKRSNNKLAQCVLCWCACCFACLEGCLQFISKNAYIQTAIFSTPFCISSRKAYYLITRNVYRIAAISCLSTAVLVIGKLFIASLTTLAGYYYLTQELVDDLHSVAGPTVLIFLLSYWVSDFFLNVYDMTITCILHCFLADEEMFPDNVYADDELRKYIDQHGAEKY